MLRVPDIFSDEGSRSETSRGFKNPIQQEKQNDIRNPENLINSEQSLLNPHHQPDYIQLQQVQHQNRPNQLHQEQHQNRPNQLHQEQHQNRPNQLHQEQDWYRPKQLHQEQHQNRPNQLHQGQHQNRPNQLHQEQHQNRPNQLHHEQHQISSKQNQDQRLNDFFSYQQQSVEKYIPHNQSDYYEEYNHQEPLLSHPEPQQNYQEHLQQHWEPHPHQEPLQLHQEPLQKHQEHKQHYEEPNQDYLEPSQHYQELRQNYLEPRQHHQEPYQQHQEPSQHYQESWQQYQEPLPQHQEPRQQHQASWQHYQEDQPLPFLQEIQLKDYLDQEIPPEQNIFSTISRKISPWPFQHENPPGVKSDNEDRFTELRKYLEPDLSPETTYSQYRVKQQLDPETDLNQRPYQMNAFAGLGFDNEYVSSVGMIQEQIKLFQENHPGRQDGYTVTLRQPHPSYIQQRRKEDKKTLEFQPHDYEVKSISDNKHYQTPTVSDIKPYSQVLPEAFNTKSEIFPQFKPLPSIFNNYDQLTPQAPVLNQYPGAGSNPYWTTGREEEKKNEQLRYQLHLWISNQDQESDDFVKGTIKISSLEETPTNEKIKFEEETSKTTEEGGKVDTDILQLSQIPEVGLKIEKLGKFKFKRIKM